MSTMVFFIDRYVRHLDSTIHAIQIKTKLCQLVEAVSCFMLLCMTSSASVDFTSP